MQPSPETKLRRADTAKSLTEAGYPITASTLATMATRGGGPPYEKWGPFPIYTWGATINWAKGRLSAPQRSTSETDRAPGCLTVKRPRRDGAPGSLGKRIDTADHIDPAASLQASSCRPVVL